METNSTLSLGILNERPLTSFQVSELKRILSLIARAKALSTCLAIVGTLDSSVMKIRWMAAPFEVDNTVSSRRSALLVKCSMSSSPPEMIIAKWMKSSPLSFRSQGFTSSLLMQSLTRLAPIKWRRQDMAREAGRNIFNRGDLSQTASRRRRMRRHDGSV